MRVSRLLCTLLPLVLLMAGFLAWFQVQAQEENKEGEWKGYQKFNEDFNKEERRDGQKRVFHYGEADPLEQGWRSLSLFPEHIYNLFKVTPSHVTAKEVFKRIPGTKADKHILNGAVFEKDLSQHGSSLWKAWETEHDWRKGLSPYSLNAKGEGKEPKK